MVCRPAMMEIFGLALVHYNQPITGFLRHSSVVTSVAWSRWRHAGDIDTGRTDDGMDVRGCLRDRADSFSSNFGTFEYSAYQPHGFRVAAGGNAGVPVIWNLSDRRVQCLPRLAGAAFIDSKSDRRNVSGHDSVQSRSLHLPRSRLLRESNCESNLLSICVVIRTRLLDFRHPEIRALDWSGDGQWLAAVCGDSRNSDDSPRESADRIRKILTHSNIPFQPVAHRCISTPFQCHDCESRPYSHTLVVACRFNQLARRAEDLLIKTDKNWLEATWLSPDNRLLALAYPTGRWRCSGWKTARCFTRYHCQRSR